MKGWIARIAERIKIHREERKARIKLEADFKRYEEWRKNRRGYFEKGEGLNG